MTPPNTPPAQKKKPLALHRAEHDPRAAALVEICAVLDGQVDSQAAVDTAVRSTGMVPTDRRLCTELIYGVLRQYLRLEWFTRRFLKKPEKLPREMYITLIMGLYEMAFLRIPPHATVGWAVGHVRNRFGQGIAGVANGTLRTMQRTLPEFHRPSLYAKSFATLEEQLACLYSMPLWIVQLWVQSYGLEETLSLLHASHEPAPSGLRLNRLRSNWREMRAILLCPGTDEEDAGALPESLADATTHEDNDKAAHSTKASRRMKTGTQATAVVAALLVKRACELPASTFVSDPSVTQEAQAPPLASTSTGPEVQEHPSVQGVLAVGACGLAFGGSLPWLARKLVQDGEAQRQSAASYAVLDAFAPEKWPTPLWDCCAGRGGKTLALLEMGVPVALASDSSAARLESLRAELARRALTGTSLFTGSAADVRAHKNDVPKQFGTILIDAPCSGLGTLAHRPEIRLRRTQKDVAELIATQRALLQMATEHLAPGGCIVYLTCTRNPEENEKQVAAFLASHPRFTLGQEYRTPANSPLREFFYGAMLHMPASALPERL